MHGRGRLLSPFLSFTVHHPLHTVHFRTDQFTYDLLSESEVVSGLVSVVFGDTSGILCLSFQSFLCFGKVTAQIRGKNLRQLPGLCSATPSLKLQLPNGTEANTHPNVATSKKSWLSLFLSLCNMHILLWLWCPNKGIKCLYTVCQGQRATQESRLALSTLTIWFS